MAFYLDKPLTKIDIGYLTFSNDRLYKYIETLLLTLLQKINSSINFGDEDIKKIMVLYLVASRNKFVNSKLAVKMLFIATLTAFEMFQKNGNVAYPIIVPAIDVIPHNPPQLQDQPQPQNQPPAPPIPPPPLHAIADPHQHQHQLQAPIPPPPLPVVHGPWAQQWITILNHIIDWNISAQQAAANQVQLMNQHLNAFVGIIHTNRELFGTIVQHIFTTNPSEIIRQMITGWMGIINRIATEHQRITHELQRNMNVNEIIDIWLYNLDWTTANTAATTFVHDIYATWRAANNNGQWDQNQIIAEFVRLSQLNPATTNEIWMQFATWMMHNVWTQINMAQYQQAETMAVLVRTAMQHIAL